MKTRLPAVASRPPIVRIVELVETLISPVTGSIALMLPVSRRALDAAAGKAVARLHRAALIHEVLLHLREHEVAALARRDVEQAELGIVGAGLPVLAAGMRRASFSLLGLARCRGCARCIPARPWSGRS